LYLPVAALVEQAIMLRVEVAALVVVVHTVLVLEI
jgi:hypothetical protein